MEYKKIQNYSMKCRLYPNKEQAEAIDRAIYAVQLYINGCTYNLFTNFDCTNAKKDKDGKTVHWIKPGLNDFVSASYKNNFMIQDGRIADVPAAALTTNIGAVLTDMKKRLLTSETVWEKNARIEAKKRGEKKCRTKKKIDTVSSSRFKYPAESLVPRYYNDNSPRRSYTYTEVYSKIKFGENDNVFWITLNKIDSPVKVRGWNKHLQFGENHEMNFREFVDGNKDKVTVCIKKDNCGDYWIIFKIKECWNLYDETKTSEDKVGLDVGIKCSIAMSDGKIYENPRFKKQMKRKERRLNRKLSRRWGSANEEFREAHKGEKHPQCSKRYMEVRKQLSRLRRKVADRRNDYNNKITKEIVMEHGFIAVETLQVSNMFRNKHLAYALSDVAMGDILAKIAYKSAWYGRVLSPIDRWSPSSKRCSCCGYVRPKMTLSVREWTCPECKTFHDRDVNAAKNILYYGILAYEDSLDSVLKIEPKSKVKAKSKARKKRKVEEKAA